MKAVLNIVAAVLVAAGLVVAVASLLSPGQVILGIDFKLAATLVVGGLILHALARAVALLERMSNDLRQLRKAGSEEPPWLRQAAGKFGPAMAPTAYPAAAAAEEETEDRSGYPADFDQEVEEDAAAPSESRWPVVSEVQWPDTEEYEPQKHRPAASPEPEEEPAPPIVEEAEVEPVPEPVPEAVEPAETTVPGEVETSEPAFEETEAAGEPEVTEPPVEEPDELAAEATAAERHAEVPSRLRPSQDARHGEEQPAEEEIAEPAPVAPEEEEAADETQPELYVVEERMFRGKQARVLSDGTIEAETAEGWMRFEDFDHLEEYLEAMAEMGR